MSAVRDAAIELLLVSKHYGERVAVDRLSLRVERGECLVLLGGSGSGKTTTLKMVNRLIEPSAGQVLVEGADTREIPPALLRRRIGYGFQQVGLFPHLTVAENVGRHPGAPRLGRGARPRAASMELLELVELAPAEFAARWPARALRRTAAARRPRARPRRRRRACCSSTSPSAPSIR